MREIVSDVMDFSKPLQLTPTHQDIREVIVKACRYCKAKAEGNGVDLITEMPEQLLYAEIDGFHIERALINIVGNAVEPQAKDRP